MYLFLYFIIKKNQDKTSLKFVIDIKKKVSKRNHITKESINEKPVCFFYRPGCVYLERALEDISSVIH